MRVKIGNSIHLCTKATHTIGSNLLLLTTNNGVYTVNASSNMVAHIIHNKLLKEGYFDVSDCEYSN